MIRYQMYQLYQLHRLGVATAAWRKGEGAGGTAGGTAWCGRFYLKGWRNGWCHMKHIYGKLITVEQ